MPRERLTDPNVTYEVQVKPTQYDDYMTISSHPSKRYAQNKATCNALRHSIRRIVKCEVLATYEPL